MNAVLRIFLLEVKKAANSRLWLYGLGAIALIGGAAALFEFKQGIFSSSTTVYRAFMLYNLTFVPVKILLPCMTILMTASVFSGEYEAGLMKFYLLCGVDRRRLYWGKAVFLFFLGLIVSLCLWAVLSGICLIAAPSVKIGTEDVSSMLKLYLAAGAGVMPIVLFTTLFSIVNDDFQKSFAFGMVILVLSLALDGTQMTSWLSPTYFLSHSDRLYKASSDSVVAYAFGMSVAYLLLLNLANVTIAARKELWN